MSKKILASALAAAALATVPFAAQAQAEGPWMVRARAVHLDSANKDSTGLGLSVNNKTLPEVDISYFFTPNIAAELILTYPQKHTLYSNGAKIGSLKHLPPTLSLQYHFAPNATFRPYVGAGLNYTRFSSVNFEPAVQTALAPSIKKNSYGLSFQVGADIELSKNLFLNVDIKKAQIDTDVYSKGNKAGTFKVDPLLVGVGLGMRF
ncbi:MAG: OmpW/AlkL family protein [Roseateles asaccharophilus]|uniref:Outer membrane protein n=1 Tax=Roseateles asaccharophilus TaxID=582607 RepID=A0A4R6N283_9BURK|nr:OmpW family outer membrane protein [Roseateles asaccharophilus]MDN3544221.1 OmpW family outer membrane protein [Roseateles asaccharophilus]TDP09187.1 outer membrane protein [Roseateles asaccharophilus]